MQMATPPPPTAIMVQQRYKNYIGKWDHQAYTFTHYQAIMAKEKTKKLKTILELVL